MNDNTPIKPVKGGRYNWKNQPELLVYMGLCEPRNGRWHQFAKVEEPAVVWCEVLDSDLHMLEDTPEAAPQGVAGAHLTKLRNLLERMNRKGGLGYDVHGWISEALDACDALAQTGQATPEAEPVAWANYHKEEGPYSLRITPDQWHDTPLYRRAASAGVALTEDARDAARYRWLRDNHESLSSAAEVAYEVPGHQWDAAIDQAMKGGT